MCDFVFVCLLLLLLFCPGNEPQQGRMDEDPTGQMASFPFSVTQVGACTTKWGKACHELAFGLAPSSVGGVGVARSQKPISWKRALIFLPAHTGNQEMWDKNPGHLITSGVRFSTAKIEKNSTKTKKDRKDGWQRNRTQGKWLSASLGHYLTSTWATKAHENLDRLEGLKKKYQSVFKMFFFP